MLLTAAVAALAATTPWSSAFSTRASNSGSAFAAATLFPPSATAPPEISGTPRDGATLTASTGTWLRATAPVTVRWQRCDTTPAPPTACADITGATTTTYTPTAADVGHPLRILATAANDAGSSTASSAPTTPVAPKPAPTATTPPSITGTPTVGRTLQADDGTWDPPTATTTRRWLRCDATGGACAPIAGPTPKTYATTTADTRATLRLEVTATDGGASASATSSPTPPIAAAPPTATSPPSIAGTAQHGVALTGSDGAWTSQVAFALTRQWLRCDATGAACTPIQNATATTYAPTQTDVAKTLRLRVTATNTTAGNTSATADSAPTAPVMRTYENEVLADAPLQFLRMRGGTTATAGPNGVSTGIISWTDGAIATDAGDRSIGMCLSGCGFTYAALDDALLRRTVSAELWFQTIRTGALLGQQAPAPFAVPPAEGLPWLYVGFDGHLWGGSWDTFVRQITSPGRVDDGRWHHTVMTRTATTITLYLDGRLVGTLTGGPWYTLGAGSVALLGNGWTAAHWPYAQPNWYFDYIGSIDEPALYDHALTPERIAAHRAASGR